MRITPSIHHQIYTDAAELTTTQCTLFVTVLWYGGTVPVLNSAARGMIPSTHFRSTRLSPAISAALVLSHQAKRSAERVINPQQPNVEPPAALSMRRKSPSGLQAPRACGIYIPDIVMTRSDFGWEVGTSSALLREMGSICVLSGPIHYLDFINGPGTSGMALKIYTSSSFLP